jgi:hypothetical protein
MSKVEPQPEDSAMDDYSLFLAKEIERLRAVIAETPEGKRLHLFERHLREYQQLGVDGDPVIMPTPSAKIDMSRYGRDGSKAAVIVKASEAYLKRQLKRAQSSEIAQALQEAGIELPEEKASAFVSSYLSTSPLFDNVKGAGYGLVEWQQQNKLELT